MRSPLQVEFDGLTVEHHVDVTSSKLEQEDVEFRKLFKDLLQDSKLNYLGHLSSQAPLSWSHAGTSR